MTSEGEVWLWMVGAGVVTLVVLRCEEAMKRAAQNRRLRRLEKPLP